MRLLYKSSILYLINTPVYTSHVNLRLLFIVKKILSFKTIELATGAK